MAGTKVTPRIFDAAKTLLESDAPIAEIARFMKLSWNTVKFIEQAENYDEYKTISYEFWKSKHQKTRGKKAEQPAAEQPVEEQPEQPPVQQIVEHRQTVTVQATHYVDGKLDKVVELLTIINNKLGAIIDDLYGTGTKGGAAG